MDGRQLVNETVQQTVIGLDSLNGEEVPLFPPWIYGMFGVCILIAAFSCYKRRQTKKLMVCKHNIEEDEIVYRCKTCEKHATAVLCRECFTMSEHRHHEFKELKAKRRGICHCGLKESFKRDRLCLSHKNELQNMIESRVQYYEINGHRIPISPDGVPMINQAKPVAAPTVNPFDEIIKNNRRRSNGIKGIILGQRVDAAIAGSRISRTNGSDPLKFAVDTILQRREERNQIERRRLLGEEVTEDDDPYTIGNISERYIRRNGELDQVKKDLNREHYILTLQKMRKMQAANHIRFENEIFGDGNSKSSSSKV